MSYSYDDEHHEPVRRDDSSAIWLRGLFMLLFIFLFGLAQSVLFAIAVIQFIWMLIKREPNLFLAEFGASLSLWMAETARFLVGDTQDKPFPWRPWPMA